MRAELKTKIMSTFNVPKREEVSSNNQAIFDNLEKAVGFVPNLFATYAYSENALANYLNLSNGKTSLNAKQKEVVNLAVSEVNNCIYCLSLMIAVVSVICCSFLCIILFMQGSSFFFHCEFSDGGSLNLFSDLI